MFRVALSADWMCPNPEPALFTIRVTGGPEGRLSEEECHAAAAAFERDGVIALQDAVPLRHVDELREKMLDDLETYDKSVRGPLRNNWQGVRPPPTHPWLFKDIVFNRHAIEILRHVLGGAPLLITYGANTAFPGNPGFHAGNQWTPFGQNVLSDTDGPAKSGPTRLAVMNVLLSDTTAENAATMIWPGSHTTGRSFADLRELSAESEAVVRSWRRPPELATGPRGTIIIRDPRGWHRGTINHTRVPRIMLSIAVIRGGKGKKGQFGFEAEEATADFWRHTNAGAAVWLVPTPDYLHQDSGVYWATKMPWLRNDAKSPDWSRL